MVVQKFKLMSSFLLKQSLASSSSLPDHPPENETSPPSTSCPICCEAFNKKSQKAVQCIYCKYSACKKCTETYLLSSVREMNCMNCREIWDREFIVENFTQKFIQTDYKQHREKMLLESEKSLLPQTQRVIENMRQQENIRNWIREMRTIIIDAERELGNLVREEQNLRNGLNPQAGVGSGHLFNSETTKAESLFIRKCPKDDCRGFLKSEDGLTCGLCGVKCCKRCNEILEDGQEGNNVEDDDFEDEQESDVSVVNGNGSSALSPTRKNQNVSKDKKHKCKPEDVKTAKFLRKDTKPCPGCGSLIHKIDGCNQMWCTQCHLAFDWKTGETAKGTVHNPEYFRYLRENQGNAGEGGAGGAPRFARQEEGFCAGGQVAINNAFIQRVWACEKLSKTERYHITSLCRKVVHLRDVTTYEPRFNPTRTVNPYVFNQDLRLDYLNNRLSEQDFAKTVQKRDKAELKKVEMRNILDLLVNVFTDITTKFLSDCEATAEGLPMSLYNSQIAELVRFVNLRLLKISEIYSSKPIFFSDSIVLMNM